MHESPIFTREDILRVLPHRPPFLFVDRVMKLSPGAQIVTERDLLPDEVYFAGHFPQKAIMPGVLITDALAQTAGLLWGLSRGEPHLPSAPPTIFFLASVNMKYTNPAFPGETLRMTVRCGKSFGALFGYEADAAVGRKTVAAGSLTLAMAEGLQ